MERAGAQALSLLGVPINIQVLTALEEGPTPLMDLRRAVGSPPQTTLRVHLKGLTELGALERRDEVQFPGTVEFRLTPVGVELLEAGRVLGAWLDAAPEGPISLGSAKAKSVIKALVDGWSSAMMRALAARPLSLTELSGIIPGLNYPSLERRLGALRLAGLVEVCSDSGRSRPCAVTPWLREAVAPLVAAARWERRNLPRQATPLSRLDVEAILLLVVPVLELPASVDGVCRIAVEVASSSGGRDPAGVLVEVEQGKVRSCVTRLQGEAGAWAAGSPGSLLQTAVVGGTQGWEIGGDSELARALLEGVHQRLFAGALSRADTRVPS